MFTSPSRLSVCRECPPLWATISKAGTWISGRTFSAEGRSTWRPVNLYAQQVRRVAEEDGAALHRAELKFNAYSPIGGQKCRDAGRWRNPIPCCITSTGG